MFHLRLLSTVQWNWRQVTMADREAAERAVKDANPIIDGRKANVNLAYLGAKPRSNNTSNGKFFLLFSWYLLLYIIFVMSSFFFHVKLQKTFKILTKKRDDQKFHSHDQR